MEKGQLYLIPVDLVPGNTGDWIGTQLKTVVQALRFFVVEHPKSARQFLKALNLSLPELTLEVLDEHSGTEDVQRFVHKLEAGVDLGLLSEAGCPAIADPGAALVEAAHHAGFRVVPLVGPSSITLALMASGLEGQRFAFCGYLPREKSDRDQRIRALEKRSRSERETEIFIETPYRNEALFAALMECCNESTGLCVAADLTLPSESVVTKTVGDWRREKRQIGRRPAVFLLLADSR